MNKDLKARYEYVTDFINQNNYSLPEPENYIWWKKI